ncbi:MAG: SLBB domain-containing protein [Acidobacteria bacterium]|nr:SLBB domain-containing protein [Acidobacteriota bacterium]
MKFFAAFTILLLGSAVAAAQGANIQEDLVHFGDVVDVDVVGGYEFDWRGSLNADGFLEGYDAYGDPIPGLCRSEAAIAADVTKVLSKILRDPKVVVKIVDRSNRAFARLDGAVRTPTRFSLKRNASLRELIVLAGGFTDDASGEISIYRSSTSSCSSKSPGDNGSQAMAIKVSDLLKGDLNANPQILSGDLITVEKALPVYVIGAVNNPRPVFTREKMTVSRAVESAGGLTKEAEETRVTIFRKNGTETSLIEIDLDKVKRGETDDAVLKPFDIIDVAARGGLKRKYPPVAALQENKDRSRGELPLRVVD